MDALMHKMNRPTRIVFVSMVSASPALLAFMLFWWCPPLAVAFLCCFPLLTTLGIIESYALGYFK